MTEGNMDVEGADFMHFLVDGGNNILTYLIQFVIYKYFYIFYAQ